MSKARVLFLCGGNSCRSQMAEAFLRKHGGDRFEPYSAGLDASEIHPLTLQVMQEKGIDLLAEGHRSKTADEFLGKLAVRYLVIVCDAAAQKCPSVWPGAVERLIWPFDDPPAFQGSDEAKLDKFREVRDAIEQKLTDWLATVPATGHAGASPSVEGPA